MRTTPTYTRALDVLRSRVRFETAALRLPGRELVRHNDTPLIREATRVYVETWIVPLIDALQSGEMARVKEMLP